MKISEVLNNVKKAELEANKVVAEAQQKAVEIIKKAEEFGDIAYKETFEEAVKKHREDINIKIEKENLEAGEEAKAILLDAHAQVIKIQKEFSKNVKEAVKTLLEEITI